MVPSSAASLATAHGPTATPDAAAQAASQPSTDRRGRVTLAAVRELLRNQPELFPEIQLPAPNATTPAAMPEVGDLMATLRQAGFSVIALLDATTMPNFNTNDGSTTPLETEDEM